MALLLATPGDASCPGWANEGDLFGGQRSDLEAIRDFLHAAEGPQLVLLR